MEIEDILILIYIKRVDREVPSPRIDFRRFDEFHVGRVSKIAILPFLAEGGDIDFNAFLENLDRPKSSELITSVRQKLLFVFWGRISHIIEIGRIEAQQAVATSATNDKEGETVVLE